MKTKILIGLVLIFSLLSFTFASHDPMHSEEDEYGCTDSTAENYDPNATVDDGSCNYAEYGCTDANATNFNPNATVDDGSCDYGTCGDGTCNLTTERCSCAADCGDGGPVCREQPPVTYKFCGDVKALNDQTQGECRAQNNARPIDPCVRDDNLCRYPEPPITTGTGGTGVVLFTQCVRQTLYFDTMPDLTTPGKIAAFNRTYADIMCTNGGRVSAPFIFNNSLGTFRVTCVNATSVDTDAARCTYTVSDDAIDGGLTTLTTNEGINGGLTTLNSLNSLNSLTTLDGGINGGLTTLNSLNSLNSLTTLDGGINGGLTTLNSLNSLNSLTTLDGGINGGLTTLNSLDGGMNDTSGTSNNRNGGTSGSYSISGSVLGDNTDIANVSVKLVSNGTTLTTTTDSSGRYSFNGLGVGSYQIKPENKEPYIFYSTKAEITDTSIQGLNFSGINIKKIDDPNVAELLRRGTENTGTEDGGFTSLNDWINRITNNAFGGGTGGDGTGEYDEFGNLTNDGSNYRNIFSNNSLFQLLSSGYLPFSKSYSPIALSLITKFANQNAICGNGIAEDGETCDDGVNNGKTGQCSSDCLYLGEVRFTNNGLGSSSLNDSQNALGNKNVAGIIGTFQKAGNTVSGLVQGGVDIVGDGLGAIGDTIDDAQEWTKNTIIKNTSPRTRKIMKQTAAVAEEVAKYSVIGVTTLLGVAAASMQVMVYKSQWTSYTVQEGDTLDSIGNKFTMTERAMRARNKLLKKGGLRPGMKIKVRNRHFIEKDYLDQLKSVLKDGLEKRHYGRMAGKIDKMFAKK